MSAHGAASQQAGALLKTADGAPESKVRGPRAPPELYRLETPVKEARTACLPESSLVIR